MSHLVRSYAVYGLHVTVTSNDLPTLRMLEPRLRRFVADSVEAPDLSFRYRVVDSESLRDGNGYPADARTVYDSVLAEVVYDDATDRLHIVYPGRLALASDARTGVVTTDLGSPAPEDRRLATHPFFTLAFLDQLKRRALYGLHAALLCRNGLAVVIPGGSGAGKSTLTLCLLRAGFALGGDDLCFLQHGEDGLRILAFPDEIDVAEDTARFFPELHGLLERPRPVGAPKWPLLPEEVYPTEFVRDCAPGMLVFPRVGAAAVSTLSRMDPAEALLELVPNVLLTEPASSQRHLDVIGELVHHSRCFRLTTGQDFDSLPALLENTLSSHAS